jgi:hypothetical protein
MDRFAERSHRLAHEAIALTTLETYGTVADDFPYLAKTPANTVKQALEKIGKSPDEVELFSPRTRTQTRRNRVGLRIAQPSGFAARALVEAT